MMRKSVVILSAALLLCMPARSAFSRWHVWTMTQTKRVLRDAPPGEVIAVNLSAARNEWESFQILMRADEPIIEINVVPADLVGPGGAVLKASEAKLYREHQFYLGDGSFRNRDFKTGWYPDALIPFINPVTGRLLRGARFTAVPFRLPPDQTHGFWCDLYVPASAKPGLYRGTYKVTASGGKSVDIPVTLWVWDFELPALPTMKTWFGTQIKRLRLLEQRQAEKTKGQPFDGAAAGQQVYQLLSEHHINDPGPHGFGPVEQPDGSYRIPERQFHELQEYIDKYHINLEMVRLPAEVVNDPLGPKGKLRAWLAAFDALADRLQRPDFSFVCYLYDEPHTPDAYDYVRKWGRAIRDAKSVVQVMVTASPEHDVNLGDLRGAVDIWCPLFAYFPPATVAKRRALGETIWAYTALCQGARVSPWWEVDFPLLHYRVPAWIMWRYRVRGLLYWSMTWWDHVDDPWVQPDDYHDKLVFNGEGTLLYPGRDVGYEGVAPSMRLKAVRDSIEDYEYMAILERLGLADEAAKVVKPLADSWYKWDHDPVAYELARYKLAKLIEKATGHK